MTAEAGAAGTGAGAARTASGCVHEAKHVGETHHPDGPLILMGDHAGGASDVRRKRPRGTYLELLYIEIRKIFER